MTGDLVYRIVCAWATQEGQAHDYVNPGNLRDCPWFPLLLSQPSGKPAEPWAPGVPRRVYPGGEEVLMLERFRNIGRPGQHVSIGWFWMPRTRAEGIAGMRHVLELHIAEGDSLGSFIGKIAPASDGNDPGVYETNVAKWAGIEDPRVPLWTLLPDLVDPRVS